MTQILRGVYPERAAGILRSAQEDKRRACPEQSEWGSGWQPQKPFSASCSVSRFRRCSGFRQFGETLHAIPPGRNGFACERTASKCLILRFATRALRCHC